MGLNSLIQFIKYVRTEFNKLLLYFTLLEPGLHIDLY